MEFTHCPIEPSTGKPRGVPRGYVKLAEMIDAPSGRSWHLSIEGGVITRVISTRGGLYAAHDLADEVMRHLWPDRAIVWTAPYATGGVSMAWAERA